MFEPDPSRNATRCEAGNSPVGRQWSARRAVPRMEGRAAWAPGGASCSEGPLAHGGSRADALWAKGCRGEGASAVFAPRGWRRGMRQLTRTCGLRCRATGETEPINAKGSEEVDEVMVVDVVVDVVVNVVEGGCDGARLKPGDPGDHGKGKRERKKGRNTGTKSA